MRRGYELPLDVADKRVTLELSGRNRLRTPQPPSPNAALGSRVDLVGSLTDSLRHQRELFVALDTRLHAAPSERLRQGRRSGAVAPRASRQDDAGGKSRRSGEQAAERNAGALEGRA